MYKTIDLRGINEQKDDVCNNAQVKYGQHNTSVNMYNIIEPRKLKKDSNK